VTEQFKLTTVCVFERVLKKSENDYKLDTPIGYNQNEEDCRDKSYICSFAEKYCDHVHSDVEQLIVFNR
jgi:hypothetical protein